MASVHSVMYGAHGVEGGLKCGEPMGFYNDLGYSTVITEWYERQLRGDPWTASG
jgi:hypothetical protein